MKMYKTKAKKLPGTNFEEAYAAARSVYEEITKNTKRKPYVRSAYFQKDKIFLDYFWEHLFGKHNRKDRLRRIKYYKAAIELIVKNLIPPESKENPNKRNEILHRFIGETSEGNIFFVQIKEEKRSGNKHFISVFPDE